MANQNTSQQTQPSLFSENMAFLKDRWPNVAKAIDELEGDVNVHIIDDTPDISIAIKGKRITSCYSRIEEARLLSGLIPFESEVAHVYGIGLADNINLLLQRESIKELHVYILSSLVFNVYLNLVDGSSWLTDERIQLHFAKDDSLNTPYTFSSGEFAFVDKAAEPTRNKLLIERNEHQFKSYHDNLSDRYKQNIKKNLNFLGADSFIEELAGAFKNKDFICLAAGPSVDQQITFIKENRQKYKLICVNSSLMALEKQGIIPDFVVAIEQSDLIKQHFNIKDKDNYRHVPLIYLPSTCPDVIKDWPGSRVVAVTPSEQHAFYQLIFPESMLFSGGSVAHTAVAVAEKLGAASITLIGYDFCYPSEKTHLKGNPLSDAITSQPEHWVTNGAGQRCPTAVNLLSYAEALEEFIIQNKKIKFYKRGKSGLPIKGATWMD